MANRRTRIKFPVFNGYEIRVIQARDVEATARRLGCDDGPAIAFYLAYEKGGYLVLPKDADAGTVAHECSHAIRELFRCVGANQDEEAFAYHLDYLVGRVHKFLKGRKR